jgi:hypothetical protein
LLKTQLILKKVISEDDWHTISHNLQYDFLQDGHFAELKQSEMMRDRIALVNEMRDMVGKYFSVEYMRKNVLKQSESEIQEMDKQIKQEIDDGIISSPFAQADQDDDTPI